MIYDLGCFGQPDLLPKILSALPGAGVALAVIAGLAVIGAFLNRSACFQAHDIFSGWGSITAVMTLSAVFFTKALPFATLALFLLIIIAAIATLKRRIFVSPFWLLALFPGLFILTAINIAGIAKWDDFSHWVPNALYLFQHDSVPGHSLPPPYSAWPGYPYALPFLTYMASWLAGGFLVQGGAMINFLLLIGFASMLAETSAPSPNTSPLNLSATGKAALALILVTIANPGFNASFTITSQGDTPTMILTGVLALLLWRITNALRDNDRTAAAALIWPVALSAIAFLLIKQSNIVLFGLLIFAFLIVAAKNGVLKPALTKMPVMILPALVLRFIWQYYVNTEMTGNGFAFHSLNEWRFDLLGPLVQSMAREMARKNGLSALMLIVTGFGATSLFRPATPHRNFALMAGIIYSGYLCFLTVAYIGSSFAEAETLRAASFYRYCTHTGLLGILALWMATPEIWKWIKNKTQKLFVSFSCINHSLAMRIWGVFLLAALLPVAFLIHPDWVVPQPGDAVCATRAFGNEIAQRLPPQSRLAIIDSTGNALDIFIVNFELALNNLQTGRRDQMVAYSDPLEPEKLPPIMAQLKEGGNVDAVLLRQPTAELKQFFDLTGNDPRILLLRRGQEWQRVNLPPDSQIP